MISTIAQAIGKQYQNYVSAFKEAQALAEKETATAEERKRLVELTGRLRSDRSKEFLLPGQKAELENVLKTVASFRPMPATVASASAGDYLSFESISCVDADGKEFEKYGQLLVRKDIIRVRNGLQQNFTPYNAAVYCEQQGMFLPSFALSCNILAALYQNRTSPDSNHVLMQYKDKGDGNGYQAQNTVINYGAEHIIHYPTAADFKQAQEINRQSSRTPLGFSKATLEDSLLEDALRDPAAARYIQQLTGLSDPSVLVEIGKYFGKPAKLWFPWNGKAGKKYSETRACWLGCCVGSFNLFSDNNLSNFDAARGVRSSSSLKSPAGGAL